ncbi:hypothetical protein BC833DRAFT_576265 [Globomyces pollinis-pini]|nr:hypothetical protein BC833DRAFT_576265 [Globomyces pollinis-pini]
MGLDCCNLCQKPLDNKTNKDIIRRLIEGQAREALHPTPTNIKGSLAWSMIGFGLAGIVVYNIISIVQNSYPESILRVLPSLDAKGMCNGFSFIGIFVGALYFLFLNRRVFNKTN